MSVNQEQRRKWAIGIVAFGALALSSVACLQLIGMHLDTLDNDGLFPSAYFKDVFDPDVSVSGWVFGYSPQYFPDLLIFGIADWFSSHKEAGYLAYGFYFWVAFVVLVVVIAHAFLHQWVPSILVAGTACALVVIMGATSNLWYTIFLRPAGYHGSSTLVAWCLPIWLLLERRAPLPRWRLAAVLLVVMAMVASDRIFVVHGVLPLIVLMVGMWRLGALDARRLLGVSACMGACTFFAQLIPGVLDQMGFGAGQDPPLSLELFSSALRSFVFDFVLSPRDVSVRILGVVGWVLAAHLLWTRLRTHRGQGRPWSRADTLVAFTVIQTAGAVAAVIVMARWGNVSRVRYILPFVLGAPLWAALFVVQRTQGLDSSKSQAAQVGVGTGAIFLATAAVAVLAHQGRGLDLQFPYPMAVACVESAAHEIGADLGMGPTDLSRQAEFLSKKERVIIHLDEYQVRDEGQNTNRRALFPEPERHEPFFVIVKKGDPTAPLSQRYGPPTRVRDCHAELDVWLYEARPPKER
jgi:hypothetical protein